MIVPLDVTSPHLYVQELTGMSVESTHDHTPADKYPARRLQTHTLTFEREIPMAKIEANTNIRNQTEEVAALEPTSVHDPKDPPPQKR